MLTYWKSITKHLQTREWTLYSYAPTMTHVPLPLGTDAEPILFLYLPPHEIVSSLRTVFNAHFISISGSHLQLLHRVDTKVPQEPPRGNS